MIAPAHDWQPTMFKRYVVSLDTNRKTAIIDTDAGRAYIKPMMASKGHHPLACEWVGTQLAKWFGLPTLDYAILYLDADDEIPLGTDGKENALPGPAFTTRKINGDQWDGSCDSLDKVENTDIIPRLVAFDTWTLNWDRFPPQGDCRKPNYGNVFLTSDDASTAGKYRILAIDHTECFSFGQELKPQIFGIDRLQERRIYGFCESFKSYLVRELIDQSAEKLGQIDTDTVREFVETIPTEWDVNQQTRDSLVNFISSRATFLADNIVEMLNSANYMGGLF